MKTKLYTAIAAAALVGATAVFGYEQNGARDSATVEFLEPEKYSDFRLSEFGHPGDQEALEEQLRAAVNRVAARYLPEGYHLTLRFRDIDMAGDFEPFRGAFWRDVRIVRSIYPSRLQIEYAVTDADGNVVTSGERRLVDSAFFSSAARSLSDSSVYYEIELIESFVRQLGRSLS